MTSAFLVDAGSKRRGGKKGSAVAAAADGQRLLAALTPVAPLPVCAVSIWLLQARSGLPPPHPRAP